MPWPPQWGLLRYDSIAIRTPRTSLCRRTQSGGPAWTWSMSMNTVNWNVFLLWPTRYSLMTRPNEGPD